MKLKKVTIKNFRGFIDETFELNQMTGLIGKNDVGKSTILEALDIFFNAENKNGIVTPEVSDLRIDCSEESSFSISCYFEISPNEYTLLDSSNQTNLKEEHLLNNEGLLEIVKIWDCSKASITAKSLSIYINAKIPYLGDKQFLTMKIAELRKELEAIKTEINNYEEINKSLKAEIRKALYKYYTTDIEEYEKLIEIKALETDNTDLWKSISKNLPLYFLFQSDRINSDSDNEVQNPLKFAAKKAIADKQAEIEAIEKYVIEEVSKVGNDTVNKLEEFDSSIAKGLLTKHKTKPWENIFSFEITDDKEIPLNKRGSGVRRLILLSYFRAEAEKALKEDYSRNIIYAIEEPETAQHPDFQLMILESLEKICEDNDNQVIFTTHTPELAKMLVPESLILIIKTQEGNPIVEKNTNKKIEKIIDSLGILPSIQSKCVICVEGENDIDFLRSINEAIFEFKKIIDLKDISIIPMSGGKLKQWINRNYLESSNVKEFHLYDSDVAEYCELVQKMNETNDGRRIGVNTALREMENYIPLELLLEEVDLEIEEAKWRSEIDVPKFLLDKMFLKISDLKKREIAIKGYLNKRLTKKVSSENLKNYKVYDEMESWFHKIAEWSKQ